MSFRAYIAKRRITDTPAGDFVTDARSDKTFPDAKSLAELQTYLGMKGACDGALDAAKTVWRGYQASKRVSR